MLPIKKEDITYFPLTAIFIIAIFFLYGYLNFKGIISYLIISFIFSCIINKYYYSLRYKAYFSYTFISLVGLLYAVIYLNTYNSTFGPFFDDSFYYYNAISLSNFRIPSISITLFEVFLSSIILIIHTLTGYTLNHIDLLPLNWVMGALSVILVLQLCVDLLNINKIFAITLISVLFNFNFIDTVAHLYRDSLIILLSVHCISKIFESKYKLALFLIIIISFLRGANGILLLYLLLIHFLTIKFSFKVKNIILITIFGFLILILSSNYISGNILRGGFTLSDGETLSQVLNNRMEVYDQSGEGGILELKKGNIIEKSIYPIVYLFTPFNLQKFNANISVIQSDKNSIGYQMGDFNLFNISAILILLHIIFIGTVIPPILIGCYYTFIKGSTQNRILLLYFLLTLLSIAFISMQARHRIAFIIFFPFWISSYFKYRTTKVKRLCFISSFFIITLLIIINT